MGTFMSVRLWGWPQGKLFYFVNSKCNNESKVWPLNGICNYPIPTGLCHVIKLKRFKKQYSTRVVIIFLTLACRDSWVKKMMTISFRKWIRTRIYYIALTGAVEDFTGMEKRIEAEYYCGPPIFGPSAASALARVIY